MRNATKLFTSTFGAIMALAGLEHGVGEVLQGSVAPAGMMIMSWPTSEFFRSLAGEPAMTIVPNLLVTGILAILSSLILLVWAAFFVQRKNGGLIMILLSVVMLLVGGGIFPPLLGIIVGAIGTKIDAPLPWWRSHLSVGFRHFLGKLWPHIYTACIIAWLSALLGPGLLGYFFGVNSLGIIVAILFFAFGTLLLTIFAGFAYDIERQIVSPAGRLDSVVL